MTPIGAVRREADHFAVIFRINRHRMAFEAFVCAARQLLLGAGEQDRDALRDAVRVVGSGADCYGLSTVAAIAERSLREEPVEVLAARRIEHTLRAFLVDNYADVDLDYDTATYRSCGLSREHLEQLRTIACGTRRGSPLRAWLSEVSRTPAKDLLGPLTEYTQVLAQRRARVVELHVSGACTKVDPVAVGPAIVALPAILRTFVGQLERGTSRAATAQVAITTAGSSLTLDIELRGARSARDLAAALGWVRTAVRRSQAEVTIDAKGASVVRMVIDVPQSEVEVGVYGAEARLRQALEVAREASATKSRFLASMSHELRTPLNAIIGYSEMVLEGELDPVQRSDIEKVQRSGRHLLALVNDVLDLSKVEAGAMRLQPDWVDANDLVCELSSFVLPSIDEAGNLLVIDVEPELGRIYGDPLRIRQILLNLLVNASKFTQDGLVQLLVARCQMLGGEEWVRFDVNDTGIGISEEQLGRLFQPFTQADASIGIRYGGTGLGLVLARRFAELMGGELLVESTLGVGSTFTLLLPRRLAHEGSSDSESGPRTKEDKGT